MCLILRNHGLLTVGKNVADAFLAMYILQRACEIQLMAQSSASPLTQIPGQILAGARQMADQVTNLLGGDIAWPGILRRLDRKGYPYKV